MNQSESTAEFAEFCQPIRRIGGIPAVSLIPSLQPSCPIIKEIPTRPFQEMPPARIELKKMASLPPPLPSGPGHTQPGLLHPSSDLRGFSTETFQVKKPRKNFGGLNA